jgi:hypothetical protein
LDLKLLVLFDSGAMDEMERSSLGTPKLPERLKHNLNALTPSRDRDLTYWPCAARLKTGTVLSCVYVVAERPYLKYWGVYPEQDPGKSCVSIADVDALEESPCRLPARFANKLYKSGESGMGYVIFTVVFTNGHHKAYMTGNAVDFIHYPEGLGATDVIDVLPHTGRDAGPIEGPEYYWCLFSE